MRIIAALLAAMLVATCAPRPPTTSDPLVYDTSHAARATRAVIGIPGALSPILVLDPLNGLEASDRFVAFYRLPGFDGRSANEFVSFAFAAQHIADLVGQTGLEEVDLVGHSTGAAIALEAAKAIRRAHPDTKVRVVAISSALPAPQPVLAGIRGVAGTARAAARAGSLNPRKVWLEYYRYLAYGPGADTNPQVADAADALVDANQSRITLPQEGLARRHTRDLRGWRNADTQYLEGVDVTLYHGAVDPVFPPKAVARFARTLPQAELRLVEGHGHLLMLTFPEIWNYVGQDLSD